MLTNKRGWISLHSRTARFEGGPFKVQSVATVLNRMAECAANDVTTFYITGFPKSTRCVAPGRAPVVRRRQDQRLPIGWHPPGTLPSLAPQAKSGGESGFPTGPSRFHAAATTIQAFKTASIPEYGVRWARGAEKAPPITNRQGRYRGLSGAERQTPVPPDKGRRRTGGKRTMGLGLMEDGMTRDELDKLTKIRDDAKGSFWDFAEVARDGAAGSIHCRCGACS